MISSTYGYAIVDNRGDIMLFTLATNRQDAWRYFMDGGYERIVKTRANAKRKGFKCVRVDIQTEEYKR